MGPYVQHTSFKAIHDRLEALRNNAHLRTPAHKLANLADKASATLTVLLKTLCLAAGECINIPAAEFFVANIVRPMFASVIAAVIPQLPATITPSPANRVTSELPTCSSLPSNSTIFSPNHNAQWFRSACYHFSNLRFPTSTDIVARGDVLAECFTRIRLQHTTCPNHLHAIVKAAGNCPLVTGVPAIRHTRRRIRGWLRTPQLHCTCLA